MSEGIYRGDDVNTPSLPGDLAKAIEELRAWAHNESTKSDKNPYLIELLTRSSTLFFLTAIKAQELQSQLELSQRSVKAANSVMGKLEQQVQELQTANGELKVECQNHVEHMKMLEQKLQELQRENANCRIVAGIAGTSIKPVCCECNKSFVCANEIYRCADCDHLFHKPCLKKHFEKSSHDEKALIGELIVKFRQISNPSHLKVQNNCVCTHIANEALQLACSKGYGKENG